MTSDNPKKTMEYGADAAHSAEAILAEARALRKSLHALVRELKRQGIKLEESEIFTL